MRLSGMRDDSRNQICGASAKSISNLIDIGLSPYIYIYTGAPWAHMGQGPFGPASQCSSKAFMPPWEGQGALKCHTCVYKEKPVSPPLPPPPPYMYIFI